MGYSGKHLLGIRGLSRDDLEFLISTSAQFVEIGTRRVKKVPSLRGKTIINLFLEPSTRTRTSFEIAGKRLSADVINVSGSTSSTTKGETLVDTVLNIRSMGPDVVVLRHAYSGSCHLLQKLVPNVSIINAGDGLHEHPTQALLDALTIQQHFGRLDGLTITLVGDVLRSRVARSTIHLHRIFGNKVRVVAPPTLLHVGFESLGVERHFDLASGLPGSDIVVSLRMKHEYAADNYVPNLDEYARRYILSPSTIQKYCPDAMIMAPGPIVRGVEISSSLADGPSSLILKQVQNGVAVRMAMLFLLATRVDGADPQLEEELLSGEINSEIDGGIASGIDGPNNGPIG